MSRLLLAVAGAAAGLAVAVAAPAAPPKKPPPPKEDPAAIAHKKYSELVKEGEGKYIAKDVAGAIDTFQKATAMEPRNPLGYYLLGEAELGNGDTQQAESAWLHASQVADEGPPGLKGKIYFVIADLRERQKRWDDAKAAWDQYLEVVSKLADGAFPAEANGRKAAIEAMATQDKAYDIVRQRVRDEKKLLQSLGVK